MELAGQSKESVVYFGLDKDLEKKIREALESYFALARLSSLEEIINYNPIAVLLNIARVEWPLGPWFERARFLSGAAQVILLGDLASLPGEKREELWEAGALGFLGLVSLSCIGSGQLLGQLQVAVRLQKQSREIANLKNVLGKDAEIQHELAFRSEALAREKDFSANIVNSITSGLMILDGEGNVVMLNDEAKNIHRVPGQKDYLAVHYDSIFQPRVNEGIKELLRQVQEKGPKASFDRLLVDEDLILSWKCYAVYDPSHHLVGTLHLFEDITKQESTERQLLQAEKLATIGTMLSGVAHELRNPLAIISGRAQRLLSKKEKFDEWSVRYLQSIEEQTSRCGQIVNNLLNFSRRESAGYNLYDINAVLDEVLTYVDYQNIFDNIHVTKKYGSHIFVFCDKLQMTQVFLNLILNAADAMKGKGDLTLSTRQEADRTVVSVADSGEGIDPKIMAKIFDPFFTTKEAGKGTGLGLSISYRIVQQHGGEIRVHSKPGDTAFEVIIPVKR